MRPSLPPASRAFGMLLAMATCLMATGSCGPSGTTPTHERSAEGARLYRTYCGLCHGDRGEGYAADDANALANQDFLASVDDEFLRRAIREGHPGTAMAAYGRRAGGPLDDRQIDVLVAYVRGFQERPSLELPRTAIAGDAAAVRPVYERECAGCHGERGQGVTALSLNNPVFHATASDAQIRHAIAKGRRGTPMPAFEGRLTPAQLDGLVSLIRTFARGRAENRPAEATIPDDLPLVAHPDGPKARFTLREGRFVPALAVKQALERGERVVLLDARAPSDWLAMHIPGAVPCPYYAVEDLVERLPRDGTFIVAYCGCPHAASGRVVDALRERGFENTAVLDEGVLVWRDLGYPVEGESVGR